MKLKRSREHRVCHNCGADINKGSLYASRSITIISDPQGQSFNGGKDWVPFRLTQKLPSARTVHHDHPLRRHRRSASIRISRALAALSDEEIEERERQAEFQDYLDSIPDAAERNLNLK